MSTEKERVIDATNILRIESNDSRPRHALARAEAKPPSTALAGRGPLHEALTTVEDVRKANSEYAQRERGPIAQFLGLTSPRDKRLEEHDLAKTSIVVTASERDLQLAVDIAYEDLAERANAWLTSRRIEARSHVVDSATVAVQQLKYKLEDRRQEYRGYVRLRSERLEAARDLELLYDVEAEDLRREIKDHYAFLAELEALFRHAVQERVG
jgi:hypothetical protein